MQENKSGKVDFLSAIADYHTELADKLKSAKGRERETISFNMGVLEQEHKAFHLKIYGSEVEYYDEKSKLGEMILKHPKACAVIISGNKEAKELIRDDQVKHHCALKIVNKVEEIKSGRTKELQNRFSEIFNKLNVRNISENIKVELKSLASSEVLTPEKKSIAKEPASEISSSKENSHLNKLESSNVSTGNGRG